MTGIAPSSATTVTVELMFVDFPDNAFTANSRLMVYL